MKLNKQLPDSYMNQILNKIKELVQKVEECFQSVSNGKSLVASAITDKKVPTDATATFAEMAANIESLKLGSGNAVIADVLEGKTFTNSDGIEYTGTMPNINAIDDAIASNYVTKGSSGTGIYARMNTGAHVTLASSGHAELFIPQTQIVTMFSANATAAQILKDKTAWVNGTKITGTMPNQGAKTASLNCGGSYTIPAGYHNGSGKVTANSLASQTSATAVAAQISKGYTAWVNGVKITGTRPAVIKTLSGSVSKRAEINGTTQVIVKFTTPFDTVPTVSIALNSATNYKGQSGASYITISKQDVTKASFVLNIKNSHTSSGYYMDCVISWSASA